MSTPTEPSAESQNSSSPLKDETEPPPPQSPKSTSSNEVEQVPKSDQQAATSPEKEPLVDGDDFTDDGYTSEDEELAVGKLSKIAALEHYLLSVEKKSMSVDIQPSGVKRKKMSLTKTIVYQLEVKIEGTGGIVVWREYEEFVLLTKHLSQRLSGVIVPPLPPHFSIIGGVNDYMLGKRLFGLQSFINNCLRHPYLRNDLALYLFLHSPDPITKKAFEAIAKDVSEGKEQWEEMVSLFSTPQKALTVVKSVQTEATALIAYYQSMIKEVKTLTTKLASFATTFETFSTSFDIWKNLEQVDLRCLAALVAYNGATPDNPPENLKLAGLLELLIEKNSLERSRIIEESDCTLAALKSPIKYEIMFLEHVSKEVDRVKEYLAKYKKTSKTLRYLEVEALKLKPLQTADGTIVRPAKSSSASEALEKKIVAAKEAKTAARAEADFFITAVLEVEMRRYRYERGARMTKVLQAMAKIQTKLATAALEQWSTFEKSVDMQPLQTGPDRVALQLLQSALQTPEEAALKEE